MARQPYSRRILLRIKNQTLYKVILVDILVYSFVIVDPDLIYMLMIMLLENFILLFTHVKTDGIGKPRLSGKVFVFTQHANKLSSGQRCM